MGVIPLRRKDAQEPDESLDALMLLVSHGDDAAFARLFDRTSAAVYGTCRRVLRDPAHAEEVAQEVMLEVWRSAPRFDRSRGGVMTWVLTLAHRRAVDRVRSVQASRDRETRAASRQGTTDFDHVAEDVEQRLEQQEVARALATLTPIQREAITLAYYQGYTHTQVAEALDIPLGTAKTRVRDGLIRLRDAMGVSS